MSKRLLAPLFLLPFLALPGQAQAPAATSIFLSFATLKLGSNVGRVNAMGMDETNRLWVTTDQGVAGIAGTEPDPFFPLTTSPISGGLADSDVRAVAFGRLSDGENFFLGFNNGAIQYGRILSTTGVEGLQTIEGKPVNAMASDGTSRLWVGTVEGLAEYALGEEAPDRQTSVFTDSVQKVAVAPWTQPGAEVKDPAVLFSSGDRIFQLRAGDSAATEVRSPGLTSITSLVFDGEGNLWASGQNGASQELVRYPAADLQSFPQSVLPTTFAFSVAGNPTLNGVAVDSFTNTVWLATSQGAYFQVEDGSGNLAANGWEAESTTKFDRIDAVLADAAGNIWFGTDRGVRGLFVRLMVFSSSRYVGETSGTLTVQDLTLAGNGTPDAIAVEISVGGTAKTFAPVEEEDTGTFRVTFGFTLASSSASDSVFSVQSSATGVAVTAKYAFVDALGRPAEITAASSWANEAPFEDDLLLGGPCFLTTLRL